MLTPDKIKVRTKPGTEERYQRCSGGSRTHLGFSLVLTPSRAQHWAVIGPALARWICAAVAQWAPSAVSVMETDQWEGGE